MNRSRLFQISLAVVAYCLVTTSTASDRPSGYEGYQVVEIMVSSETELDTLRGLEALGRDFQVWSEVVRIGPISVRVAPAAQPALQASGLRYKVTIADLQKYLDRLYGGPRDGDFFDSLRTYAEHVQFMEDLANSYPDLAEMISVGQSVEGREMWALRISGAGNVKPGVMYHGAEHGNEQAPASVVAYMAHHLLTNYDTDPEVAALVDHAEWYLLPIMNPDGYVRYDRWNAHGVDLNRNWDGPGAGHDPSGGPYPFSEPETANMRDFFLANPDVRAYVDLHGYVPWIMWVWAHIYDYCEDHDRFYAVGSVFRDRVYAAGGGWYEIGTIREVAYYISGCSTNYAYGELSLWAFAIEVVDDDMPEICEEFLSSMLYLGEWIWETDCNGNGVDDTDDIDNGTSQDENGNGIPDECEAIPGDLNGDGCVDQTDLGILLADWGCTGGDCPGDCNGDGDTNQSDLGILLAHWGEGCP